MKLSNIALKKHVALARGRVQELESFVKDRRAMVEEMSRKGLVSGEAKAALAEAEIALAERRSKLEYLLRESSRTNGDGT
jgi:hypothetical protein